MFRLQVTLIKQTFQYMDMTYHVHVLKCLDMLCHVHVLKCLPDDGSCNRNM